MSNSHRLLLAILLGAVLPSFAMQLGASKGSAVFGRPLDLTVPVRFDAPIEDPFNCFSADIFQADTKFDAGRVRIDVTPAANGLDAVVRIRSSAAVIEPWAKVILRNNCGAKVTRQYDFLTDFAADMPAISSQSESVASNNLPSTNITGNASPKPNTPTTAADSNALPILPSAPVSNWSVQRAQASAQANAQTNTQTAKQPSVQQTPVKPRRALKPNAFEPKPTALAAEPANVLGKVAQMGQSRLKMETFELTDEHQVLLKLSTAMIAPSGMRTPEEIQALAQATAVWRAINGMPAATVAQAAPLAVPTAAIQSKPPAIVKDGKYQFSNPIVYGLIGLLALTLACIAWLWTRVRRGAQLGYGWLEEPALADTPLQTEPPQVSQRWSAETAYVPEDQVDEFVERTNTEHEEPNKRLTVAASDASPLEALTSIKETLSLQKSKASPQINAKEKETKVFSAANAPEKSPVHFDDSRFDKDQLVTKFNTSLVHEVDLNTLNESVDFVVTDSAPPKLHAVPSPVEAVEAIEYETSLELEKTPIKSGKTLTESQQASTNLPKKEPLKEPNTKQPKESTKVELNKELPKEEANAPKGNMIDFDIFADQVPLRKPPRFGNQ